MPGRILMFAGPKDDEAFRQHAESIGMLLLHPFAGRMTRKESKAAFENPQQGGLFSFLGLEDLHPDNHPSGCLCEVVDPLLPYFRPWYQPPYLVAGQVVWNTDVKELAQQTRPYFQKLRRWVQKNWKRRQEDKYYIGPDAQRILQEQEAQIAYMPPNVTTKSVILDRRDIRGHHDAPG